MIKKTLILCTIATTIGAPIVFDSISAYASNNDSIQYETSYSSDLNQQEDVLNDFLENIKSFKDNNPDISDKDFENYVDNLLTKNSKSTNPNLRNLEDYISGKLNSKEQALYNKNKSKGLLCMANGKLAIKYSEQNYKSSELHNGNGDAFRHALWNYGMALDVGVSFAKEWSTAHEEGAKGQPAIEKKMDLFNNNVGLHQINVNSKPGSISKMISIVKARVRAGGCQVIRNGKITNSSSAGEK